MVAPQQPFLLGDVTLALKRFISQTDELIAQKLI